MLVPQAEPFTVLLAEDDDGHADLVMEQLRDAGVGNPITRFRDGQELVDFLLPAGGAPWDQPCLLLLDINMPRLDGIAVLKRLKADPAARAIPVIMLTTTDDPCEVAACYRLGCNLYITKPVGFDAFAETLKRLGQFLQILQVVRP
jgi:CheY-like chemotaxis protein